MEDDTDRFNLLRMRYKTALDAYHSIAARNAAQLTDGRRPSEQELADERRAAADLQIARDNLMAANRRAGR